MNTKGAGVVARQRSPEGQPVSRYPESSAWDKPGFLLWHATLEWQRRVTAVLREVDLTHVQFVLLAGTVWLEQRSGPPSQRELADHASTDAMMTSQIVRVLEKAELIERRLDEIDTRVKRLRGTKSGTALAKRAVKLVEAVDREAFVKVDDLGSFLDGLRSVARRDSGGMRYDDGDQ